MSMVRRSSFNEVKGFNIDLQFFQDYDLWYRINKTGAKFKYINDTIFHTE
jgi:GT2 family glycosyltransferase